MIFSTTCIFSDEKKIYSINSKKVIPIKDILVDIQIKQDVLKY